MDPEKPCPLQDCKHPSMYREIIETVNDANLTQMVNLPTRENNIIDLFLTTKPSLVNNVNIMPGIIDHNIVEVKVNASAKLQYKKPRGIILFKKTD